MYRLLLTLMACAPIFCAYGHQQVDGSKYLLSSEPKGAKGVIEARKTLKDKEEVVLVGRIGGSQNPWVRGRAAFTIVDPSLKPCSDIPGDNCPTPWDYCCEPNLAKAVALIKVVDDQGKLVQEDARILLKVKELTTVIVPGIAQWDKNGSLTVLTRGVYVKK